MRRTKPVVRLIGLALRAAGGDVMTLFEVERVIETDRLVAAMPETGERMPLIERSGRGGWMSTLGSAPSASKWKFSYGGPR